MRYSREENDPKRAVVLDDVGQLADERGALFVRWVEVHHPRCGVAGRPPRRFWAALPAAGSVEVIAFAAHVRILIAEPNGRSQSPGGRLRAGRLAEFRNVVCLFWGPIGSAPTFGMGHC